MERLTKSMEGRGRWGLLWSNPGAHRPDPPAEKAPPLRDPYEVITVPLHLTLILVPLPALSSRCESSDVIVFLDINNQSGEHENASPR
jgi:hypothetical protein